MAKFETEIFLRTNLILINSMVCLEGTYGVPVDESHYRDLLKEHTNPPPATVSTSFIVGSFTFNRCSIWIWDEEYYLVLPFHRCVLSTVHFVLSQVLWKQNPQTFSTDRCRLTTIQRCKFNKLKRFCIHCQNLRLLPGKLIGLVVRHLL